MIIKPMVRNNICINTHPIGCERETGRQIDFVAARQPLYAKLRGPKAVLVVGASTGYGLASRVAAAFGFGAATVGVAFEKEPTATKGGTPGWYNTRAFEAAAKVRGIPFASVNGDAFSKAVKDQVVEAARALGVKFDLIVYSLASPVRTDPETGVLHRSVIKPIGSAYRGRTVDLFTKAFSEAEIVGASEAEITDTVKVMGGEDWALWIEALEKGGALARPREGRGAATVAYSYLGPSLSWPIYRDGTIGRAKAHLDATALELRSRYAAHKLEAYVSVNKALVTRSSAVIPIIPLYVSTLFKVMKEKGNHEDCVAQIDRLYRERLYAQPAAAPMAAAPIAAEASTMARGSGIVATDPEGRIRLDDLEMSPGVQAEVEARMAHIDTSNVGLLSDVDGFRDDFLRVHGFAVEGVDYSAEVAPNYDPASADASAAPVGVAPGSGLPTGAIASTTSVP